MRPTLVNRKLPRAGGSGNRHFVNCAGAIRAGSIDMVMSRLGEGWNQLFGSINLTREIYPAMCRRGSG
jgi:hypothetical protein